ncbi:MAG: DUF4474 domain-containing protein [Clostridia bacterium]|nr:DUF4474 domain-containing protein [Clostridia bacterium]
MKIILRITAAFLCAVFLLSSAVSAAEGIAPDGADNMPAAAVTEPDEAAETEKPAPQLVLTEMPVSLSVGSKITIKAEPVNFETQPKSIEWSSDNTKVATVDGRGVVSCLAAGRAKITASAKDGETPVSASCVVNVAARNRFAHFFLSISYSYSPMGDYYYSNNNSAWQKPFGFMRLYDVASQIIGYQYDFKRMVFTYGNKDWLIELWKGQYALFQYGGEIGVYTKYAVGFGDTPVSTYRCAAKGDWLDMEMILYQKQSDGTMRRVFTRDYGKYWWCDGYRVGRLRKSKPASELQMVSRITLKDEKMTDAFVDSMKDTGFTQVDSRDRLRDDCFFRDGCDVYYIWRNLTESQHLIPMFVDGDILEMFASMLPGLHTLGTFVDGLRSLFNIG